MKAIKDEAWEIANCNGLDEVEKVLQRIIGEVELPLNAEIGKLLNEIEGLKEKLKSERDAREEARSAVDQDRLDRRETDYLNNRSGYY